MSASGQSETDRDMKPGKAPLLLPPPSARLPHAIAAEVGGVTAIDPETQTVALSIRTADGKHLLLLSVANAEFLAGAMIDVLEPV